jgi:hypothetical protein
MLCGQVKVDNMRNVRAATKRETKYEEGDDKDAQLVIHRNKSKDYLHVQTSSCNICRHQDDSTFSESSKFLSSVVLRLASM